MQCNEEQLSAEVCCFVNSAATAAMAARAVTAQVTVVADGRGTADGVQAEATQECKIVDFVHSIELVLKIISPFRLFVCLSVYCIGFYNNTTKTPQLNLAPSCSQVSVQKQI